MSLDLDVGSHNMVVVVSFRLALFHLGIYFVILAKIRIFFPLLFCGPVNTCTVAFNSSLQDTLQLPFREKACTSPCFGNMFGVPTLHSFTGLDNTLTSVGISGGWAVKCGQRVVIQTPRTVTHFNPQYILLLYVQNFLA